MRICFNMQGVGLANNGGSRTLIRCVEVLRELGHDAFFWSGKSHYTWHKPKIKCVGGSKPPKCDVVIATGINSYKSTVTRYPDSVKRVAYMRGLELWKAKEHKLLKALHSVDHVFANSEWQYRYLKRRMINATLQYPGLDTQWFEDNELPRTGVGAMMHNKHGTKRSCDAEAVEEKLGISILYLNRHIKRPDSPTLNAWYNGISVWLAPTELEGLHNPPMEAALAGCALVCTDANRSGMHDYAVHGETALLYSARDIDEAACHVQTLLHNSELRATLIGNTKQLLRKKIGTRRERMKEFATRLDAL